MSAKSKEGLPIDRAVIHIADSGKFNLCLLIPQITGALVSHTRIAKSRDLENDAHLYIQITDVFVKISVKVSLFAIYSRRVRHTRGRDLNPRERLGKIGNIASIRRSPRFRQACEGYTGKILGQEGDANST